MAGLVRLETRDKQIIKNLVIRVVEPGLVIYQLSKMFPRINGPVLIYKMNRMVNAVLYEKFLGPGMQLAVKRFMCHLYYLASSGSNEILVSALTGCGPRWKRKVSPGCMGS